LQEERPYWEQYFDLTRVQDAHDRRKCKDENGTESWACSNCDCTARLELKLRFLDELQSIMPADALAKSRHR
jgi:Zn-finger protein